MSYTIDSATFSSGVTYETDYSGSVAGSRTGGVVFLSGYIQCPAISSGDNQNIACTLPTGWRPTATVNTICIGGSPAARVRISSDGAVRISALPNGSISSGTFVQLSGISYLI